MIRYALKCSEGHSFESWFQSAEAYDKLANAGMIACATCGNSDVSKALMAPPVRAARKAVQVAPEQPPKAEQPAPSAEPTGEPPLNTLSAPKGELEQAISDLRKQIETSSDYVGKDFAKQARDMHLGDAPERAIYGEAKPEEAKALLEDGVPVMPLPFLPNRKTN